MMEGESIESCIEKLKREVSETEEEEGVQLSEKARVLGELFITLNEVWDLLERRIERSVIPDDKKTHLLKALSELRKLDLEKMRLNMENINNIRNMTEKIGERVWEATEASEALFRLEILLYDVKVLGERIEKLEEPQRSSLLKKLQHIKNKSGTLIEDTIKKIEVIFNLLHED